MKPFITFQSEASGVTVGALRIHTSTGFFVHSTYAHTDLRQGRPLAGGVYWRVAQPLVPTSRRTIPPLAEPGINELRSASRARAVKRERMLALLDRISANRERLRELYGEFDVDNEIYEAREERDRYLEGF